MKILKTKSKTVFTLEAVTEKSKNKDIIRKPGVITEDISNKMAYVYVGKELEIQAVKDAIDSVISNAKRDYQIDIKTFTSSKVNEEEIVYWAVVQDELAKGEIYNAKKERPKLNTLDLINVSADGKKTFEKAKINAETQTFVRDLQATPPNILNSEEMAERVKEFIKKNKNLSIKVLNKKEISELGMGLILGVNQGSKHEPRVVVIEYKGDEKSKDKTAIIGKGITFDSGGYNLKGARFMSGMKYDMSGAAVVAGVMNVVAQQKPKANISGVLCITDNKIGSSARTPDSVDKSMSGITVEINNTDAEGRLVMADGLTYAIKKLKATRLIDISTLTGAMSVALGETFTGVWTTNESDWDKINLAAKESQELIWRMPFHRDFTKYIKSSKFADLYNTDMTGKAGSSSAGEFLRAFTEDKDYIHIDIAGTAEVGGVVKAPMVRTLAEFVGK